ncbi:hypothetical protein [Stomatohabitans albus]|uniref:hypothetical protein n=1 Tax=Stomatohabitans albus TaxID=3110766 RepID=UPI00300C38AB
MRKIVVVLLLLWIVLVSGVILNGCGIANKGVNISGKFKTLDLDGFRGKTDLLVDTIRMRKESYFHILSPVAIFVDQDDAIFKNYSELESDWEGSKLDIKYSPKSGGSDGWLELDHISFLGCLSSRDGTLTTYGQDLDNINDGFQIKTKNTDFNGKISIKGDQNNSETGYHSIFYSMEAEGFASFDVYMSCPNVDDTAIIEIEPDNNFEFRIDGRAIDIYAKPSLRYKIAIKYANNARDVGGGADIHRLQTGGFSGSINSRNGGEIVGSADRIEGKSASDSLFSLRSIMGDIEESFIHSDIDIKSIDKNLVSIHTKVSGNDIEAPVEASIEGRIESFEVDSFDVSNPIIRKWRSFLAGGWVEFFSQVIGTIIISVITSIITSKRTASKINNV